MIIGLCGYSKVGKDTLCERLQNYERHAFADVLKAQVTLMLKQVGIEADLWGKDKEQWRDMLVFWGRKMRSIDRDYWVKQLYMRTGSDTEKRICITDVRYPNEVRWIKSKQGVVIGIDRPGYHPANEEEAISIREIRIQHPDIPWVVNDGTPRDLEVAARNIIRNTYSSRFPGAAVI
jgi:hypothetical protein